MNRILKNSILLALLASLSVGQVRPISYNTAIKIGIGYVAYITVGTMLAAYVFYRKYCDFKNNLSKRPNGFDSNNFDPEENTVILEDDRPGNSNSKCWKF